MNSSPYSPSSIGAVTSSSLSTPAPPPPCVTNTLKNSPAIPYLKLSEELQLSNFVESKTPAFNDPFTGIPSAPSDAVKLYMLCRGEPRYCCCSIPGSLFFLFMFAPPWTEESLPLKNQMPSGMPVFMLRCEFGCKSDDKPHCKHQRSTYLRLYTEWLFSGGAPLSLAKLHRGTDGVTSVSFSPKVRACLYVLRTNLAEGHTLRAAMSIIAHIFATTEPVHAADEVTWCEKVALTEPYEIPATVWSHAYPRPKSPTSSPLTGPPPTFPRSTDTMIQSQPFRGVTSLQATEPDDVPPGWYLWIPQVLPRIQTIARETVLGNERFQSIEHVDSGVAAPSHEKHLYWAARGVRPSSPDATLGAEENDVEMTGTGADDNNPARNLRTQMVDRLTQARPTNTPVAADTDTPRRGRGGPRKPITPTPASPVTKPTRLRLIAPRRPSTPEQAALFEEAMNGQSPPHAYIDESEEANIRYSNVTNSAYSYLSYDATWQIHETIKKNERDALRAADKKVDGVGLPQSAYDSCLFNQEDWK